MEEILKDIIYYLSHPEAIFPMFFFFWQIVRMIFIVLSIILVVSIVFLLFVTGYLEDRFLQNLVEFSKAKPLWKVKIDINLEEVTKKAKEGKEADRKLAVIEMDDTINSVLDQLGYKGDNLAEKLDGLSKDIIPNIEELQKAHRVRRDIDYDPNRGLSKEEAMEIISIYKVTLKDLQLF